VAQVPLTSFEINKILQTPKVVKEDVRWSIDLSQAWAKCELDVKNKLKVNLKLYLNWNTEEQSLFSFSLVLNNAYRIAGIDFNGSHRNRHTDDNFWTGKTHKHKWTEKCRDSWAYTPEEITSKRAEDVFKAFCRECNIDFQGKFLEIPPKQLLFKEM